MKPGHNSEQDQIKKQHFHKFLGEIKTKESEMAGTKGDLAALYDRAKTIGISKDVLKLAKKWSNKSDAEISAEVQDIVFVAKELRTAVGRQLSILDEDRAPSTEIAFDAGYMIGVSGGDATNPYDHSSDDGQAWQNGMSDGNKLRNATLLAAVEDDEPDDDEEPEGDKSEDAAGDNDAGEGGEEFTDDEKANP